MSKLITALVAAGLGLGLNIAFAQNVDSDKGSAMPAYNEAGERQIGLEQYQMEQQRCQSMSGAERSDCLHLAKVRYEGWAIMQCELVSGASRNRCYQNVQAATMGAATTVKSQGTNSTETGQAGRRGAEEDKPRRQ